MQSIRIWDAPVRLVHWALVICLVVLFVSVNAGWMRLHFYAGYTLSALLVFRLLWALVGTTYARFSGFNLVPGQFLGQLGRLARGQHSGYLGHNPAGAVMVLLMLGVLALQAASGLFHSDDVFWYGPFNFAAPDWALAIAGWLHPRLPPLILTLVGAHILAVFYHRLRLKEPLIGAMVHGRKPAPDPAAERSDISRTALLLSLAAALVWLGWLLTLEI